jgi:hypothetical protein
MLKMISFRNATEGFSLLELVGLGHHVDALVVLIPAEALVPWLLNVMKDG